MPILPPPTATPYDSVNTVLNSSRVRLNDAITTILPITGKLLENNQIFTQELCNTAWRKFQEFVVNLGYGELIQEGLVLQIPPVAAVDPAIQVRLDWFGYFDGQNLWDTPRLPPDLMSPIKLWERVSGTGAVFGQMRPWIDGIISQAQTIVNSWWEWRAGAVYMPGSTQTMDIRVRYNRYLQDFLDNLPTPGLQWFQQPVPMMRCRDALAYFICAEIAEAREDLAGVPFRQRGEDAAKLMVNRDISMKQRVDVRRQPRSGRFSGSGYGGGGWC